MTLEYSLQEVNVMKTKKDLEEMKNNECPPFSTRYEYFIELLADYYISKINGQERIKSELMNWNKDAQLQIIGVVADRLNKEGISKSETDKLLLLIE